MRGTNMQHGQQRPMPRSMRRQLIALSGAVAALAVTVGVVFTILPH